MKREALIILGLITITLTAFSGLGQCGFVNFDDPAYVVNNPRVTEGLSTTNFAWAWKTFEQGNYIPLTWLSLMLDATVFGSGPHGFHWVNLAFHVANVILVYLFFREATGAVWRSALLAAIFAVHPLRVESVVWVVERKDVLSGFFGLLTMLAFLRYTKDLRARWYVAAMLLFTLTLLAKQVLSIIPFVLLLLDYWPLGRWCRGPDAIGHAVRPRRSLLQLILEKIPMLLLAVTILLVTLKAQASGGAVSDLKTVPWSWRLANVPVSYARYLQKMVWFGNLAVFYPRYYWIRTAIVSSSFLLVIVTVLCLWNFRSRPWLIIGWLWFLGVLVPMIGFAQFGPQAMADRFTYISGIGLLIMLVWSIPDKVGDQPVLLVAAVGTVLGLLVVFTFAQTRYWQNSITLFTRDIEATGSTAFAELNLGVGLFEHNELPEALVHLKRSVYLDPHKPKAQCALASALAKDHQLTAAISHSLIAVECQPNNTDWHLEAAYLLLQARRNDEALQHAEKAVMLSPRSAEAHHLLGVALCENERYSEGISHLELALAIQPGLKDAQRDLQYFQNSAGKRP